MARTRLRALLCAALAARAAAASDPLALSVDRHTGEFHISYGGRPWLSGSTYRVGKLSSASGTLFLSGTEETSGVDKLGAFHAVTLDWATGSKEGKVIMKASFRQYEQDSGAIVFEQFFPSKVSLQELLPADASLASSPPVAGTLFPGFDREGPASSLNCFAYHGVFSHPASCTLGTYQASPVGGVPLVIYNASAQDLPMLVFSPLSNPMAHQMGSEGSVFGPGIKATVEIIPAGWSQLFILSAGTGINDGMMSWGDRMLKFTGRARVDNRYRDDVHGGIGFWTDNGGFYHYAIGDNKSLGSNYEEVLPKVKQYHESIGVPFKHWQFDSWFYPKDGKVSSGGGGGAVTNWTALPDIFPNGMAHIQSLLKVPMVMHNRQWSNHSDYIRNWPDIEWYLSKDVAIPKDPLQFFTRFFKQQEGWGLAMYEQDWLNKEYDLAKALQTNISMGDLWLYGMATGAEQSGRTVQYCMPYPNELLSAAAYPAVTNARATSDYFHTPQYPQWGIGNNAMFLWALNILPFKDGFYSSTNVQTGGQTVGPEKNPDREALISVLSGAMVGPMDGIYLLNASRVMATCRKDGTVLKPDRPLTTTDACFRAANPTCLVYHTYSHVKGLGKVHYYFNNDGTAPLRADEVYQTPSDPHAVYNWYTGEVAALQASNKLTPGYEGHIYAVVTPVVHGWAFLGEVRVYVPASTLRFPSLQADDASLKVEVHGVEGESLRVCAARAPHFKVVCEEVSFETEGSKSVTFNAQAEESLIV